MQGLLDRLKKDPKVRDAEGLAAYIVRRCGKKKGQTEDVDMDLAESIARFRQLNEKCTTVNMGNGRFSRRGDTCPKVKPRRKFSGPVDEAVKVGDYVSAVDGTAGFVDEISDGRASYTWMAKNDTKREWKPVSQLMVNPGGPPR